jgi:transcriptional regulator with XRE-family HTH domain
MPSISVELRVRRPDIASLERDTLGARLKRRRLELGLRQTDAASKLGIGEGTLVHWEREQHAPPASHYPAIIRYLGYEPWPEPITLGERLRAGRLRRGLSIKEAARQLQVDEGTFANWEHVRRSPSSKLRATLELFLKSGR